MTASPLNKQQLEQRRMRAVEMMLKGHTWQAVGDELYNGDRSYAFKDAKETLAEIREEFKEDSVSHINGILARMDFSLREARNILVSDHPLVADGRIVRDGLDGPTIRLIADALLASGGEMTPELRDMSQATVLYVFGL